MKEITDNTDLVDKTIAPGDEEGSRSGWSPVSVNESLRSLDSKIWRIPERETQLDNAHFPSTLPLVYSKECCIRKSVIKRGSRSVLHAPPHAMLPKGKNLGGTVSALLGIPVVARRRQDGGSLARPCCTAVSSGHDALWMHPESSIALAISTNCSQIRFAVTGSKVTNSRGSEEGAHVELVLLEVFGLMLVLLEVFGLRWFMCLVPIEGY
ncbi:hypothetical protein J6590_023667 [Homalodisca vitripennis]|nr:hypothetical protein J6590_023667 [Homalodisca vitripennis]